MERPMPSAISCFEFIIIKWYTQHKNYGYTGIPHYKDCKAFPELVTLKCNVLNRRFIFSR